MGSPVELLTRSSNLGTHIGHSPMKNFALLRPVSARYTLTLCDPAAVKENQPQQLPIPRLPPEPQISSHPVPPEMPHL
ncbi:hypothetical protein VTN31DRAFT_480 [Thermomyces dupontii]|uniref:uncharacterized protein n=1 Tax=Talaromyces thermophilus TaxID=28565 RepID=UPI003742085D